LGPGRLGFRSRRVWFRSVRISKRPGRNLAVTLMLAGAFVLIPCVLLPWGRPVDAESGPWLPLGGPRDPLLAAALCAAIAVLGWTALGTRRERARASAWSSALTLPMLMLAVVLAWFWSIPSGIDMGGIETNGIIPLTCLGMALGFLGVLTTLLTRAAERS
jgi:hypothetical protein